MQLQKFQVVLSADDSAIVLDSESETISIVAQLIKDSHIADPIERGVSVLLAFHNYNEPEEVEELVEEEVFGQRWSEKT